MLSNGDRFEEGSKCRRADLDCEVDPLSNGTFWSSENVGHDALMLLVSKHGEIC